MGSRKRELMVGLFAVVGLLLAVGSVVWLAAAEVLTSGKRYVAFFGESVGAVSAGSPVKYMGLEVGSVRKISVAPDPTLMAVEMKINRPELVTPTTVCEIKTLGFTGVGFMELSRHDETSGRKASTPPLTFEPELPVIPSRPSGMSQLLDKARGMVERIEAADVAGLVGDIDDAVLAAKRIFTSEDLARVLEDAAAAAGHLETVAANIDRIVGDDSFGRLPDETERTLRQTRRLVTEARRQIEDLRLEATADGMNDLVRDVDDRSRAVAGQVGDLVLDLRQAAESLNRLLERANQDPSLLLFSKPAQKKGAK